MSGPEKVGVVSEELLSVSHLFVLSQVDKESKDTPVGCEDHEVQKQNVLEE